MVLINIYIAGFLVTFLIIFSIAHESMFYKFLSALLIALTWPVSLIPALFFSII